MIAEVVPIARIRRDTTAWSYRVPKGAPCSVGSLVRIALNGRPALGVVWALRETDERATADLAVVTEYPLLLPQHRALIEELALSGLTSLATALHVWAPAALRKPSLQPWAEELLAQSPLAEPPAQQAILSPVERADLSLAIAKLGQKGVQLVGDASPRAQLTDWVAIRRGTAQVGYGRERALYAPWCNLAKLSLYQPEHVSYYAGQAPYLSLVELAGRCGELHRASVRLRSSLPGAAAYQYWQLPPVEPLPSPLPPAETHWVSLEHEPLVSVLVVSMVRTALAHRQSVLIIHNAHDRMVSRIEKGIKTLRPTKGIEQASKELAAALGLPALPATVRIGTRSLLSEPHHNLGLAVYLSADHFLQSSLLADSLHGWADLCLMLRLEVPVIVQARDLDHPGLVSLRENRLEAYLAERIAEQSEAGLPPFGTTYFLSHPEDAELASLRAAITYPEPWQASQPAEFFMGSKAFPGFFLHHPGRHGILPGPLRSQLMHLERPWKIMHNPWFLL